MLLVYIAANIIQFLFIIGFSLEGHQHPSQLRLNRNYVFIDQFRDSMIDMNQLPILYPSYLNTL